MRHRWRGRARNVVPILIEGMRRLEYRGYDSSGVAVINGGRTTVSTARVADLARRPRDAHRREHGHLPYALGDARRTDVRQRASAHQQRRDRGRAQRHHREFRVVARKAASARLQVRLADRHRSDRAPDPRALRGDLLDAVKKAVEEFHGAYAIAVISAQGPGRIIGARAGSPLLVGMGEGDNYLASDALALSSVTQRFVFLEEGDVVDIGRGAYAIYGRRRRASLRAKS